MEQRGDDQTRAIPVDFQELSGARQIAYEIRIAGIVEDGRERTSDIGTTCDSRSSRETTKTSACEAAGTRRGKVMVRQWLS